MEKGTIMASANASSKIWLILGIVMIVLALGSGYMAMSGASTMKSGGEALQNLDTGPAEGPATDIALTVPGTTPADLEAKSYVISLHGAPFGAAEDGSEEVDFELPEVTWEITGPAPTTVTQNMSARVNDVVRAGEFTITEAGTYEVVATLPEGATNEYSYAIEDDALVALGEGLGAVGQAAGGFVQMVLGGLCGALFAVLGLIFIIVHFVKARGAKAAA
jgi:hypothetical protein